MNYLWQEERGEPFYRFQTDNKSIADKMKRRAKFKLVGYGVNRDLWIFQCKFSRPDIAKKAFASLTKSRIKFDIRDEVFYSECNASGDRNEAA